MIKKTVTALALIALFSGCTPQVSEWTPAQSPKKNRIERSVAKHVIRYPAHMNSMCAHEKRSLMAFMRDQLRNPEGNHVYLTEFGGHGDKRIDDIVLMLRKQGVRSDSLTVDAPMKAGHDYTGSGVVMMVERFFVIPPSCQDWSQDMGNAKGEQGMSNFGCADAVNMGMMVADPRDLLQGKDTGYYDGTRQALSIEMYRKDDVKQLQYESTSQSQAAAIGTGN